MKIVPVYISATLYPSLYLPITPTQNKKNDIKGQNLNEQPVNNPEVHEHEVMSHLNVCFVLLLTQSFCQTI